MPTAALEAGACLSGMLPASGLAGSDQTAFIGALS